MTEQGKYEDRRPLSVAFGHACTKRCRNYYPYEHPHWGKSAWCSYRMTDLTRYDGRHVAVCEVTE